jgi:hypothetical protein
MQYLQWDSIPGPLALYITALPTELKEISTNTVSRGGYEHTSVSITLCWGAFLLRGVLDTIFVIKFVSDLRQVSGYGSW